MGVWRGGGGYLGCEYTVMSGTAGTYQIITKLLRNQLEIWLLSTLYKVNCKFKHTLLHMIICYVFQFYFRYYNYYFLVFNN